MSADNTFAATISREELGALLSSAQREQAGAQMALRSVGLTDRGPDEVSELAKRYSVEQGRSLSTQHQTSIRFTYAHREDINLRQFASAMLATDRVARVDLGIGGEDVYFMLNRSLVFGWMMLAFGARPGTGHDEIPSRPYTRIEERFIERAAENLAATFARAFSKDAAGRSQVLAIEDPVSLHGRSKRPHRVISLETKGLGESGLLRIALPLSLLDEAHTESMPTPVGSGLGTITEQIYETRVAVHVELGFGEIALRDLAGLTVGDELPLQRSAEEGLLIKIEDTPKFRAEPGKLGKRLAVRITDELKS